MLPSSSERSARSARSLRRHTRNSAAPWPNWCFSPLGSSIKKGVGNPPTRWRNTSSMYAPDDILRRGMLIERRFDDGRGAGRNGPLLVDSARVLKEFQGLE